MLMAIMQENNGDVKNQIFRKLNQNKTTHNYKEINCSKLTFIEKGERGAEETKNDNLSQREKQKQNLTEAVVLRR